LISMKSSLMKPLGQIIWNLVGGILGRFSIKNKMCNVYRGHFIDASYQVSVHLAKGFLQRRLKFEKLKDDGHQVMAKAHIAFGNLLTYLVLACST
jgi:hypothetical protein